MRLICPNKVWAAQSLTQVSGTHRDSVTVAAQSANNLDSEIIENLYPLFDQLSF
jgi:hypothetical protein